MGLPNPSRETNFLGANADREILISLFAPVAQRYLVTLSDTLGREFDSGKRDFSHEKTKKLK